MKKIIAVLLTSALLLTAAGCGKEDETKNESSETTKVTQVAFQSPEEEDDTTAEAVEYLKTQVPLFSKYLETRMQLPLTYEVNIETPEGTQFVGMYAKDDSTLAHVVTGTDGSTETVIYTPEKLYYIIDADKTVYVSDYSEENAKEAVSASMLRINADDAKNSRYISDYDYYNNVLYKHEIIYTDGYAESHYFYDEATDALKYIVTGDMVTEVVALSNEVDETKFEIPEDYAESDLNAYLEQQLEEEIQARAGEAQQ